MERKGTRRVKRWRASGFPSAHLPYNLTECSYIPPASRLTTKVEIHRGGKWAAKSVLVSYSDVSLRRLADEGGGGDGGADSNSASLCCHPEGQFLICGRTGTAIRPVALTLAYKAKNITLNLQREGKQYDNITSSTVMSRSVFTG